METIRFKGDAATRRRFFVPESFQHPAKMASGLFLECLERYSKPGDTVLDPLAGSGTALLGAMYGRHMVLNELERHFLIPMLASWKKIQWHGPALGHTMGQVVIVRGDARALPIRSADCILTSPPWQETGTDSGVKGKGSVGQVVRKDAGAFTSYTRPQVDAVITSPPYQDERQGGGLATREYQERSLADGTAASGIPGRKNTRIDQWGYGKVGENIGNLRSTAYWTAMATVYAECWRVLRPGGILALALKGFVRAGVYQNLPGQTEALLLAAGWQKHDEWKRELYSLSFWRILQRRRSPEAFDNRLWFEEILAFRKPTLPLDTSLTGLAVAAPPVIASVL